MSHAQGESAVNDLDVQAMRIALDEAARAVALDEVPIGAAIFRGQEFLAAAHNLRESADDPLAHAEMLVIGQAARKIGDWRLNECTLAVTLEPCVMCAGAIVNARVGRVIYGAADPKAGAVESLYTILADKRLNHRPLVIGGVMAEESGRLLREFFQARRARSSSRTE